MTLKEILEKVGADTVKIGKKNLMDSSYQRRKKSSKRSSSEPINRTGKLKGSLQYALKGDKELSFLMMNYGKYVDRGTKKIRATYFFSDAVEIELKELNKLLNEYADEMMKEIDKQK